MSRSVSGNQSVLDDDIERELGSAIREGLQPPGSSERLDNEVCKIMDAYRRLYGEVPKRLDDMASACSEKT